jgi:Uncharacterised nucleotidyltransferase
MTMGRPEELILICVARRSLNASATEQLRLLLRGQIDWDYLLTIANHHSLIPLLYQHLSTVDPSSISETDMLRLRRENEGNTKTSLLMTGELIKILACLEAEGVQAIPFKGPTLALRAYGDVGLRQFGDLDILVRRKDIHRLKEILMAHRFAPRPELTKTQQAAQLRFDCAYNCESLQGVMLDVHWNLFERHFAFDIDTDRFWDRLEPVTISGKQLMTLSTEDLLLVLCLHGFTHLWERLGWICDVASLIESREDLNWQRVLANATTLGSRRILSLGLFLAADLLGATIPDEVLKSVPTDPKVQKLAAHIREQLFKERSAPASVLAEALTLVSLRERRRDRLKACLRLVTTPRRYDWMFLSVPDSLFFLYYLVRPLRLAGKYGAKIFSSHED